MINSNFLFSETSLHHQIRTRESQVKTRVDVIPEDQFLISSDQEILEHLLPDLMIEPIVLHLAAKMMNQTETQIDVSRDPNRFFIERPDPPFFIPGTQINIDIPYTGEDWIFRYRPHKYFSVFPRPEIRHGLLRISIALPHDAEPEQFKTDYDQDIALIEKYVHSAHSQVSSYNTQLETVIQGAVTSRRTRLSKHAKLAKLLDIPLKSKDNAPPLKPVHIDIRRPLLLPAVPKTGLIPEHGLTDKNYEHILHFIRHQGRTFETTPGTYALHNEEGLRNIILSQLNGHFKGAAKGEVFRGRGKTDLCIEMDNRAAFVGECKMWAGPASLTKALDQMLGYLTWRDSKATIIAFNTENKDFSNIVSTLPDTLHKHALFLHALPCTEQGEWRVSMRSKEDKGRRVSVHVFLFNLYTRPNTRKNKQ